MQCRCPREAHRCLQPLLVGVSGGEGTGEVRSSWELISKEKVEGGAAGGSLCIRYSLYTPKNQSETGN